MEWNSWTSLKTPMDQKKVDLSQDNLADFPMKMDDKFVKKTL